MKTLDAVKQMDMDTGILAQLLQTPWQHFAVWCCGIRAQALVDIWHGSLVLNGRLPASAMYVRSWLLHRRVHSKL
jgi:hypothetical protein